MVPKGTSSNSDTCTCVYPEKYVSSSTLSCVGRESVQRIPDLVTLRVAPGLREGLARLGAWSRGFDPVLHPSPARMGTELVYTAVADYGEQPSPNAAALGPIACGRAPELEEGVLDEVLGSLALAHNAVGQGEGGAAVAVVEDGERLSVALPDEGDQILVRQEQVLSPPIPYHRTQCPFAEVGQLSFFLSNFY